MDFKMLEVKVPILNPMVKLRLILGYRPIETPVKKVTRADFWFPLGLILGFRNLPYKAFRV
jgi:hypothetical protein